MDHTDQPSLHITRCPLFDNLSEATNFDPQDLSFWSRSEPSSSRRNLAFCQRCLNSYTYPFSPVSNTNLKSCLFACCLLQSKPERYHCYRISVINFTTLYVIDDYLTSTEKFSQLKDTAGRDMWGYMWRLLKLKSLTCRKQ